MSQGRAVNYQFHVRKLRGIWEFVPESVNQFENVFNYLFSTLSTTGESLIHCIRIVYYYFIILYYNYNTFKEI